MKARKQAKPADKESASWTASTRERAPVESSRRASGAYDRADAALGRIKAREPELTRLIDGLLERLA